MHNDTIMLTDHKIKMKRKFQIEKRNIKMNKIEFLNVFFFFFSHLFLASGKIKKRRHIWKASNFSAVYKINVDVSNLFGRNHEALVIDCNIE